jgi:hypothetical protein
MADRGDVMRLKRRLGFSARGEAESVIVVQATALNAALPTLLVVPLDPAIGAYTDNPAVLRVTRQELGSTVDHVAIPWNMRAVSADAFAPGPAGRLKPASLAALDDLVRLVLGLA